MGCIYTGNSPTYFDCNFIPDWSQNQLSKCKWLERSSRNISIHNRNSLSNIFNKKSQTNFIFINILKKCKWSNKIKMGYTFICIIVYRAHIHIWHSDSVPIFGIFFFNQSLLWKKSTLLEIMEEFLVYGSVSNRDSLGIIFSSWCMYIFCLSLVNFCVSGIAIQWYYGRNI